MYILTTACAQQRKFCQLNAAAVLYGLVGPDAMQQFEPACTRPDLFQLASSVKDCLHCAYSVSVAGSMRDTMLCQCPCHLGCMWLHSRHHRWMVPEAAKLQAKMPLQAAAGVVALCERCCTFKLASPESVQVKRVRS